MWNYQTASPDRYELLKAFAKENRNNMTPSEVKLWNNLRAKNIGCRFLRQHIIGDYIVDFVCIEEGLIIEVDGGYHSELNQMNNDEQRTSVLARMGFDIIRFSNEEVLFDIDIVLKTIKEHLAK